VLLTLFLRRSWEPVVGIVFKLVTGKDYIPFGPFLSAGALLALFFGEKLFFWYWNFILPPQVSQVSAILR
jgi:prepilin signal peptidase PulO-like enzyme (type II secretory pathway)